MRDGSDRFYLKFWVKWPALERSPIFNRYSPNAPKMIVVRCPQRAENAKNQKSHFAWRKSATKFLCVKTVSGIVVKDLLA